MSLVMALANSNGIVISADRRAIKTWKDNDTGDVLYSSYLDNAQKAFITENDHVIGFAGAGEIYEQVSMEDFIYQIVQELNKLNLPIFKEAEYIKKCVDTAHEGKMPIAILVAGIEDGKNYILTTNTTSPEITNFSNGINGFKEIDVTGIVSYISDQIGINKDALSVDEASKFLRALNVKAADYLLKHGYKDCISEECDIIIVTKDYKARYDEHDLFRLQKLK